MTRCFNVRESQTTVRKPSTLRPCSLCNGNTQTENKIAVRLTKKRSSQTSPIQTSFAMMFLAENRTSFMLGFFLTANALSELPPVNLLQQSRQTIAKQFQTMTQTRLQHQRMSTNMPKLPSANNAVSTLQDNQQFWQSFNFPLLLCAFLRGTSKILKQFSFMENKYFLNHNFLKRQLSFPC